MTLVFRRIVSILFLAGSIVALPFAQEAEGEKDYNALLTAMLTGYEMLLADELDIEDPVYEDWRIVVWAVNEGHLRFSVNPNPDMGLLNGAAFYPSSAESPFYLFMSKKLLDRWETRPSMAYTILSREFHSAALFFQGPQEWARTLRAPMSAALFRAESYSIQALLIRDRLMSMGFLLTPYELYLMDNLDNENMASVPLFLDSVSIPVVSSFSQVLVMFEENDDGEMVRELVVSSGRELLEARRSLAVDAEDLEIYSIAVAIHSWLEYSPEVISRIHNKDRVGQALTFPEVLALESEYRQLRQELEASRIVDALLMSHVNNESLSGFEQ